MIPFIWNMLRDCCQKVQRLEDLELFPDGVHPSDEGSDSLAAHVFRAIRGYTRTRSELGGDHSPGSLPGRRSAPLVASSATGTPAMFSLQGQMIRGEAVYYLGDTRPRSRRNSAIIVPAIRLPFTVK